MPPRLVELELSHDLALVTMNNPASFNAMDQNLGPQLAHTLEELARRPRVRAVVLTGAGGIFSGGGNLARAAEYCRRHGGAGALFGRYTQWVNRVLAALVHLPQPLVCAVHGAAAGGGLAWMLAADVVVCDQEAKLVPGFLGVGLVPGAGVSLTLGRLLGPRRAAELLLCNRPLSPRQALEWGLVHRLAPAEEVLPSALELARELAQGPAPALAATKDLLHRAAHQGLEPLAEREREQVMRVADLAEFARRVERFLARTQGKAD